MLVKNHTVGKFLFKIVKKTVGSTKRKCYGKIFKKEEQKKAVMIEGTR